MSKFGQSDVIRADFGSNNNGGGRNMNSKYVTHTELELSNEKLLHHMDEQFNRLEKKVGNNQSDSNLKFERISTKIEEQKTWLLKELSGTAIFIVTILGFLITVITFLK